MREEGRKGNMMERTGGREKMGISDTGKGKWK